MLLRSFTTILLKVLTLKKISANEYKMKKYKLTLIKPEKIILVTTHTTKKALAMAINADFFLLNSPQL
jgi:hypothetical protein